MRENISLIQRIKKSNDKVGSLHPEALATATKFKKNLKTERPLQLNFKKFNSL